MGCFTVRQGPFGESRTGSLVAISAEVNRISSGLLGELRGYFGVCEDNAVRCAIFQSVEAAPDREIVVGSSFGSGNNLTQQP